MWTKHQPSCYIYSTPFSVKIIQILSINMSRTEDILVIGVKNVYLLKKNYLMQRNYISYIFTKAVSGAWGFPFLVEIIIKHGVKPDPKNSAH